MTIKVLGACCKKSLATFENVKKAVAELGLDAEVVNIGDIGEIASYGVMSTPALVIDGKVVSIGRFLDAKDAKTIIEKMAR
jgi:small redox-active disulfide protein 2